MSNEWIEHDGKAPPDLPPGAKVDVKMKGWANPFNTKRWEFWMCEDGVFTDSNWHWGGDKPGYSEITHYRVVERSL